MIKHKYNVFLKFSNFLRPQKGSSEKFRKIDPFFIGRGQENTNKVKCHNMSHIPLYFSVSLSSYRPHIKKLNRAQSGISNKKLLKSLACSKIDDFWEIWIF